MKKVGIAFSGGAARCIAHLGVLEVLIEKGIPIHVVAGTSGGGLVGALYASGLYTVSDIIRGIQKLSWWEISRPVVSLQGLVSSRRIGDYTREWIGEVSFDQLALPLAIVAADLRTGQRVVLREGPVALAVQASCSLPVVFKPTPYQDRVLVDGGYVSQLPVLAVRQELEADFTIGVDVNYGAMEGMPMPYNAIQIGIHMASLWARKNADEEGKQADCLIRVDVQGISLTDLRQRDELLDRGRRAAESVITHLRKQL